MRRSDTDPLAFGPLRVGFLDVLSRIIHSLLSRVLIIRIVSAPPVQGVPFSDGMFTKNLRDSFS